MITAPRGNEGEGGRGSRARDVNRPKPHTLNYGPNMEWNEIELLGTRAKSLGMRADHLGYRGGWTWSCDSLHNRCVVWM